VKKIINEPGDGGVIMETTKIAVFKGKQVRKTIHISNGKSVIDED
jgi:hypothetical protein